MSIINRIYILFLLALALTPSLVFAGTYLVGQGDVLSIQVYNEEDLGGEYPISELGTIKLPLIGEVSVEGMPSIEISKMIEEKYQSGFLVSPNVHVVVKKYASQQIQVLGAVESPGSISLEGTMTLLDVFAKAGGVRTIGKSSQEVIIQRDGIEFQRFEVGPLLTNGLNNLKVQGGDAIFVTEGMTVYISGKVKNAGTVPYHSGLSLTEALAEAGGADRSANLRTVYILRNGNRIPVNVRRVMKGRIADTPLERGDYIVVQESVW